MFKILATICSLANPQNCHELVVTNSDMADVSLTSCAVGVPNLTKWVIEQHPGFRLAAWRCEMGDREKRGV